MFEGQTISVHYRPEYFSGYDHFEFTSPYKPKRPIPSSSTGYRSHFAANHEVVSAPSVQAYAHELLMLLSRMRSVDSNQLNLF